MKWSVLNTKKQCYTIKCLKEIHKYCLRLVTDLSFMSLTSIPQLFTNQFQITGYIKQVFSIRMKFVEDALFTNSQFQIWRKNRNTKELKLQKMDDKKHTSWTSLENTFENDHDNPLHFLCICLLYQSRKNWSLLCPVCMVVSILVNTPTPTQ